MAHRQQLFYACIGKAGSGKTSFIDALGGPVDDAEFLDGHDSVHSEAMLYRLPTPNQNVCMIDTPAFDGGIHPQREDDQNSNNSVLPSNETNQSSLFRLLYRENVRCLNGVFWFINNGNSEPELFAQGRFIHSLLHDADGPRLPESNWKYVVVVRHSDVDPGIIKDIVGRVASNTVAGVMLRIYEGTMENAQTHRSSPLDASSRRRRVSMTRPKPPFTHVQLLYREPGEVLSFINPNGQIQWTNRRDECHSCGQSGDYRAFRPCHTQDDRIHAESANHSGCLVKTHESADATRQGTPQMGDVERTSEDLLAIPSIAAFQCLMRDHRLSGNDTAIVEQQTTVAGVCSTCYEDASESPGCHYFWTCCKQLFSPTELDMSRLGRRLGGSCTAVTLVRTAVDLTQ